MSTEPDVLTRLEMSRILDTASHTWTGRWNKAALIDAGTGRTAATVLDALDTWMTAYPGTPPDPAWISAEIDRHDQADAIAQHRKAAHAALRKNTAA